MEIQEERNNKCRGCLSGKIEYVIDLGLHPWGNDFRKKESMDQIEKYPLEVYFCHDCSLLSLSYTVPKEVMFGDHTYLSGSTQMMKDHFQESARDSIKVFLNERTIDHKIRVLDIGSNDGTHLIEYKKLGCDVLGIESAKNIAKIAVSNGIKTEVAFFNEDFSEQTNEEFDLITASGVFFHLEELHSATRAIKKLLSEDGIFVVHFIYLKDMVVNGAFDQIYHEHLVYYLFTTLNRYLDQFGLEIFDGQTKNVHGGSGIAYIAQKGKRDVTRRLKRILRDEKDEGFLDIDKYREFMKKIKQIKKINRDYIEQHLKDGKIIYGMGAPVKGNTLLNYFGFSDREISKLVEINPLRKDTFSPGSNIPVILEDELKSKPDIYYCLAWNFRKEIEERYSELIDSGIEFYYPISSETATKNNEQRLSSRHSKALTQEDDRIVITGGSGLVGSALTKFLEKEGFKNIVSLSSKDCNLMDKHKVHKLFDELKPSHVFHIAAVTMGLGGNSKYQADVLYENVMINTNVIEVSKDIGVRKFLGMGSGCVYPDIGDQELFEDQIWLGPPHQSQASYAHSKRLMLAHLEAARTQYGMDYVFAVSGNIYGPNDTFDLDKSNVVPALIYKFLLAKRNKSTVNVWGSGNAIRDFSFSADIAKALFYSMNHLSGAINIGSGHRHSIKDIISILEGIYENALKVEYDSSKPDGQMVRYYNIDKITDIGFQPEYDLETGIRETHQWLIENIDNAKI